MEFPFLFLPGLIPPLEAQRGTFRASINRMVTTDRAQQVMIAGWLDESF